MFTKRHEQELSEIKALTYELGKQFEEIVEQLGRIQVAQERLAAQGQPGPAASTPDADSGADASPEEIRTVRAGGKPGKPRSKVKRGAGKRHGAGAGGRQRLPLAESSPSPDSHEG
jgi:hypothetical protein